MNFSTSEENYIKAIYHLQQSGGMVTTNELAAHINTRAASVTDMLKKLKIKDILLYEKYHGFQLSAKGKKVALGIVRKHRLWEYFLVNNLNFGWDEVHEIAEELEHINSITLIEKLDAYLDYPKFDPHGDPIPDVNGKMEPTRQVNLIDLSLHKPARISAVGSQSSELLELLSHKGILIGSKIEILQKFAFDHSIEIKIDENPSFSISQQLAQSLFVKPI